MNKLELNERFAYMYRKSREDAGKSQDHMARALGVSKKTIQNWEDGTSSPNQVKSLEWFEILNLQPLPYYLDALYPGRFNTNNNNDPELLQAIMDIIQALPTDSKQKILFLLAGNHGSSTIGFLELATAHLQSPLERRINIAESVATNYELSQYQHKITCPEQVQPNMKTLHRSIDLGKKAVIVGKLSYTIDTEGDEP
ncbi:MAG: helix-turn-helix domain-containing protein [Dorea sp.]|nr:helix-turn-helix domain-containing protein [Dorea sp.]